MASRILAVVTGLVVWVIVATVAGLSMRRTWPEYGAVADAMTFTYPMMFGRLSIGAVATLAAGCVAALVARHSRLATLTTGLILLALFIPQHAMLWAKFPVWYHLTFLLSLVPLTYLGGKLAVRWPSVGLLERERMMQAAERRSPGKPA